MAKVEIDKHSGFCMGVVKAINKAEKVLDKNETIFSLGDIVHNNMEVSRLENKGLKTISLEDFASIKNTKVLFRAHGEPPSTYEYARKNGLEIIDATCPVVLNLQKSIRAVYEEHKTDGTQIVIFGKPGHAEVTGLLGQTDNTAIIIETVAEAVKLDFTKPIYLFSQTTKSLEEFGQLVNYIKESIREDMLFEYKDTICRQVANRLPHLREFVSNYEKVLFVSGTKSSNGKSLFEACKKVNSETYFITGPDDLTNEMIHGAETIGICGATSTPLWLMEEVKNKVQMILPK